MTLYGLKMEMKTRNKTNAILSNEIVEDSLNEQLKKVLEFNEKIDKQLENQSNEKIGGEVANILRSKTSIREIQSNLKILI
jgi:hypothetical protein